MKKRQEEINFSKRSIDRPYYIDIEGERVWVNEEIYQTYTRDEDARKKKEEYQNRCNIIGERGIKKCSQECSECSRYLAFGKSGKISLDYLKSKFNIEISDAKNSILDDLIEEEFLVELYKKIDQLDPIDKEILTLLMQKIPISEISKRIHKSRSFITKRKQMIQNFLMPKKLF